jgi:SecD/SecF fusion protein
MLENVGRKVTLIVLFLTVSVTLLLVKDPPFNLGLDLQGGTRLVYSVDFEEAIRDGRIDSSEDPGQVLDQIIQIIRNRVDPDGLLEPIIRRGGSDRIIIELPGTLGLPSVEAQSTLAAGITEGTTDELMLADASGFPESGIVSVGEEQIRYSAKRGNALMIAKRQVSGALEAHSTNAPVILAKDDAFRAAIESLGELSFQILAEPSRMPTATDYTTERKKLDDWAAANPGSPVSAFNRLAPADGGPHESLEWVPWAPQDEADKLRSEVERSVALFRPATEDERFEGDALSRVYPSSDDLGFPAVGFEIAPARRSDFGDFTGDNEGRRMAIVLNGQIDSAPNLEGRLTGGGRIQGRFTNEDVKNLMTVLRSGSLKIKPRIENDERVGATLGDEYVRRGQYSGLLAVIAVLTFLVFYYRRLGGLAAIALTISFVMLMGALSFGNATLTLPGIAGLILTIGMAVDANILIFDRLREEMDKGRNVKQAAKEGFERAMPAILDANITTFLTALILRNVGTGPIRGFAVTLMWGIVTSVFAALVITRVLVHFSLERGTKKFTIGQWMVKANYAFMGRAKLAMMISGILILTGLTVFVMTPEAQKMGIDFVGGVETQLRTAKAESVDTVRERIRGIPILGESADVKAVLSSEQEGGYTLFRTTFKTSDGTTDLGSDSDVRALLRENLKGLLLEDAVRVGVTDAATESKVELDLLFREGHPSADIQGVLEGVGLRDITSSTSEQPNHYVISATTAFGRPENQILAEVTSAFNGASDSTGSDYTFADGIPSYTSISAQVVGELRDKALLAMGVSLFVIVLYIRVRFAEYSYGFAAVAALLHDVLITLGILTFANKIGFLNGEITLPMVGAFLTIIGYSLNDTIVIFDRVRENMPRMKKPLHEVLDVSINQTLSRTVLTSFTTLLAVGILYAFNFGTGNVLESFSFAMMLGVLTGTYSTIFIANPVLLMLEKRSGRVDANGWVVSTEKREKSKRPGDDDIAATAKV